MSKRTWVLNPQSGGVKILPNIQDGIRKQILAHAEKHYAGKYNRIEVWFRAQFCYIDAYTEPSVPKHFNPDLYGESRDEHVERLRNTPTHLCRLRYFGGNDRWSMAFYTYSHEKYEPCIYPKGDWFGTPEEAFDTSAVYLNG